MKCTRGHCIAISPAEYEEVEAARATAFLKRTKRSSQTVKVLSSPPTPPLGLHPMSLHGVRVLWSHVRVAEVRPPAVALPPSIHPLVVRCCVVAPRPPDKLGDIRLPRTEEVFRKAASAGTAHACARARALMAAISVRSPHFVSARVLLPHPCGDLPRTHNMLVRSAACLSASQLCPSPLCEKRVVKTILPQPANAKPGSSGSGSGGNGDGRAFKNETHAAKMSRLRDKYPKVRPQQFPKPKRSLRTRASNPTASAEAVETDLEMTCHGMKR